MCEGWPGRATQPASGARVVNEGPIHHVGHVVPSLDEAIRTYTELFGLELTLREELPEQHVEAAMLEAGGLRMELIAPCGGESGVARFLESRGPGMHHVAFAVPDVASAMETLRARGAELIDDRPRRGLGGREVAFLHPRSAHGVLIELIAAG